jgi:lipopolysaccharide/colanic/teichoic acid biosynthesis glycosyltransferase
MATRLIDIILSLMGILLLMLIYPLIALFIKLDSRGPILYKCDRVGKDGKIFKMYKFRTMYQTAESLGASISPLGDPRVTNVGKILRRLKLNEFPQFFNVLRGDMTLVGPRPEAPNLAAAYPRDARRIFSVKPGIAGPSQILGRNEEELFPSGVDLEEYYLKHILPRKLPIDLQYIDDGSSLKNLKYLFLSVKVTLLGAIARRHLVDNLSQVLLIVIDAAFCLFSLTLAHVLRFDWFTDHKMNLIFTNLLPWAVLIRLPVFAYFNFYHTLIRHFSLYDIKRICRGVTVGSALFVGVVFLLGITPSYSRAVFLIDWLSLIVLLSGYRILLEKLRISLKVNNNNNGNKKRVVIFGAGDRGELCLRYLQRQQDPCYEIIGFLDDDPRKRNRILNGVKVLGDRHHLGILCQLYKLQELFLAVNLSSPEELKTIIQKCQQMGLSTRLFKAEAGDISF